MLAKSFRTVVCGLVLAALVAPVAQAAPASAWATGLRFLGAWRTVAEWLDLGWAVNRNQVGRSDKAGCSMDPNGQPCPAQAPVNEGCGMDPFGRCITSHVAIEQSPNR